MEEIRHTGPQEGSVGPETQRSVHVSATNVTSALLSLGEMQLSQEDQQQHLDRVLSLIDRTLTQAREVVWNTRQLEEKPGGLVAAYREAARRIFADSNTKIEVLGSGWNQELPLDVRLESLRIVEEALHNVRLHASASKATVKVSFYWSKLVVVIKDDGIGFSPEDGKSKQGHWGLIGITERATRLGGKLTITSRQNAGTEITVVIPLLRRLPKWLIGGR